MSSTPSTLPGDQSKVTISVSVRPEEAFAIFTEDIDLWWRRGPHFRSLMGDRALICIEPGLNGRVFESFASEQGDERVVEIGRTKVWDPPNRLLFEWRISNFAPAERTEVEVLFASSASGTRVTVIHRGWHAIRQNHPARHGFTRAEFIRMYGLWWGDQMGSFVMHAKQQ
jgi:Activator of Hsp90 ATPase homolog 1-like protein